MSRTPGFTAEQSLYAKVGSYYGLPRGERSLGAFVSPAGGPACEYVRWPCYQRIDGTIEYCGEMVCWWSP